MKATVSFQVLLEYQSVVCVSCVNFKHMCVQSSGLALHVSVQFYSSAFQGCSLVSCLCVRWTGWGGLTSSFLSRATKLQPGTGQRSGGAVLLDHWYGKYAWALTPKFAVTKYMHMLYLGELEVKTFSDAGSLKEMFANVHFVNQF